MDPRTRPSRRYFRKTKNNQTLLRLVATDFDDPRRYDQSTSGRTASTGTTPPLSRSNAMAVDSAIRSFVEIALRKYPTVVPQRSAYESCPRLSSELRYVRSTSDMPHTLPDSKVVSIPFGDSLWSRHSQNVRMSVEDVRRERLRALIKEFGSQRALSDICGYVSDNYISQLLKPGKSFADKAARKIEKAAGKPKDWLDGEDDGAPTPKVYWPFSIDQAMYDRLSPTQKREVDAGFRKLVLGATLEDAATPKQRRKPA
jgi:hypothetical protein